MKITLCMIVKNEEKYIKSCLENAFTIADSAVIIDTGSTDKTIDIIKEFGNKVQVKHFDWCNDFSAARNYSLEGATGDWILILDADQKIICDSKNLRKMLSESTIEGYHFICENFDSNSKLISTEHGKLFRNKGYRYYRAVHEQINIDTNKMDIIDDSICRMIHYGYLEENLKEKDKTKRNLDILLSELEKNPKDAFVYYHIGATYGAMKEFNLSLQNYFTCLELTKNSGIGNYHLNLFKRIALNYYELEQFDDCIQFLNSIQQNKLYKKHFDLSKYVDLFYIKGLCLKKLKYYEEAEQIFNYCMKTGDNTSFPTVHGRGSFLARLELAGIYIELGKFNLVVSTYVESVLHPSNKNREGYLEFRDYLRENKLFEIEKELNIAVMGEEK